MSPFNPKKPPTPQTLTTRTGVTVTVRDPPAPEPRREPERPDQSQKVVVRPPHRPDAERDAFIASLEAEHGEFIRKVAERQGVVPESTPDVSQEVLLTAWRQFEKNNRERPTNERGWLVTLTQHEASNHKRLKKPKPKVAREADLAAFNDKADSAPDPERAATFAERRAKLSRHLIALSAEEREVVHYRDFLQMTLKETAKAVGRSVSTVSDQHARAHEKLDKLERESERATAAGERRRPPPAATRLVKKR